MNKLIAIATAGCMLVVSAPAIAAPEVAAAPAAQSATAQSSPTIGTRSKLIQRASSTPRGKKNRFLGLGSLGGLLAGLGSVFAVASGAFSGANGNGRPASS